MTHDFCALYNSSSVISGQANYKRPSRNPEDERAIIKDHLRNPVSVRKNLASSRIQTQAIIFKECIPIEMEVKLYHVRVISIRLVSINQSHQLYSRLSLSRSRRDPLKNFEISVFRHIRYAVLRKIPIEQPNFTNEHVI